MIDACESAVGVVLEQLVINNWQLLPFFSRPLRPPEQKCSASDRELLALYLAIRHLRCFLEARDVVAFTDYRPLTFTFARRSDPWSALKQRYLACISEYTTSTSQARATSLQMRCPWPLSFSSAL